MVAQQVLEDIRLRKSVETRQVIEDLLHLLSGEGVRRIRTEVLHDLLHLLEAGGSLEGEAVEGVQAVAVLRIERLQTVEEADALRLIEAEHLADHEGTIDGVLITDIAAGEVAVALLEAEDITLRMALLLEPADLLPDELEASQDIDGFDTVVRGDALAEVHGHDGLHHHRILRQRSVLRSLCENIVQQQDAGLVAAQKLIASVGSSYGDADTIAVRVGCKQEVCLYALRIVHAEGHRFLDLRVRIRAGREVTVRHLLFLHERNVRVAALPEGPGHRRATGAVQRRVNDRYVSVNAVIRTKYGLLLYIFHEVGVDGFPDPEDMSSRRRIHVHRSCRAV